MQAYAGGDHWNGVYQSDRGHHGYRKGYKGILKFDPMKIVIIRYNAGNIQSVLYALERIGASAVVTDDPAEVSGADKVIFPGVGEASTAMDYLRERRLDELIRGLRQPVLGICLGMQLMCGYSEENDTECLGIFGERVKRFAPGGDELTVDRMGVNGAALKVPQIGWNNIYG